MLKKALYLYALMLFSFTALEGTEDNENNINQAILLGCPHFPPSTSNKEAASLFALLEDDDKELEESTDRLYPVCDGEENTPQNIRILPT